MKNLKLIPSVSLVFALLGLSACGKSHPRNQSSKARAAKAAAELKAESANAIPPVIETKTRPETAQPSKPEAPVSATPTSQTPIPSASAPTPTVTVAPVAVTSSQQKKVVTEAKEAPKKEEKEAEARIEVAADSADIKKSEGAKISFNNMKPLLALSQDAEKVIFKEQIISAKEALTKLTNGNEGTFCRVDGAEKFHKDDYLTVVDGSIKVIDEENDIFRSTVIFQNKNGKLTLTCTHTTKHFYFEDVRLAFGNSINLVNFDNTAVNEENYVNPPTEDRLLGAIQISNLDAFKKITIDEKNKNQMAIVSGQILPVNEGIAKVEAGQEKMVCVIENPIGQIDSQKIFVNVEQGILEDTPKEIPNATISTIFMADKDTAFAVNCVQNKKALLKEFFSMAKGLFKFGALERREYNQKKRELKKSLKELRKAPAGK